MLIRSLASRTLNHQPRYFYQLQSLLQDKLGQESIRINPFIFHLYVQELIQSPFRERFVSVMLLDCYRSCQPSQHFETIVGHCLSNIDKFKNRQTLTTLLTQMYNYKYSNKRNIIKVSKALLSLPKEQSVAYKNLKFLIAVDNLVGLDCFSEGQLRQINYDKFRPLQLVMALQVFYQRGLQHKMTLVDEIMDMFIACEQFVPVGDLHHLNFSIRNINSDRFKKCYIRIRNRLNASIVQNANKADIQHKDRYSEQALFERFSNSIEKRYSISQL